MLPEPCRAQAARAVCRWGERVSLLLLLASVSACLAGAQPKGHQALRIGILGDQTSSPDIQASYGVLRQGVDLLAGQRLDVVLHVGDLLESTLPPPQVTALFQQAAGILDRLPVPWYLTAGDHDVNPPVFRQDSPDRSREQLFQQLYGARLPAFAVHPYYSFDLRGFHFISLYSFGALDSDSRFGNIFLSQIYDDQYDWLKSDLAAHGNARAIVVWVHQPLWYHGSGWQRVHELLRRYPVTAVVSGHFHYNQDGGELDGIHYFTVGATGGLKKVGSRQAGAVDHVSVLTVTGPRQAALQLLALDGQPLELAPRVDMDRVQALDVQLGNFFDFASINPVFLKGDIQSGQLVNDCASLNPAMIKINQIGDPLDLPLNVSIEFSSAPSGIGLSAPAFLPGRCAQVISGTECVLPRDARTFTSNYSSVDINTSGGALWQSGLSASGTPQPGTVLRFNVKTTFQGASGPLFLQTTVSTTVQACP